ncbi:MAG: hypothetical protein KAX49_20230 [Halanaerobiales bacterium]|nr:hypothetical protein [Halanaerobiales bacterium]
MVDIPDFHFLCYGLVDFGKKNKIIGLILYLATQISAFAFILGPIFNIGFHTAVIIGMAIVLVYSVMGGMIAGVYTDVFQGSIMAIAAVLDGYITSLVIELNLNYLIFIFTNKNYQSFLQILFIRKLFTGCIFF